MEPRGLGKALLCARCRHCLAVEYDLRVKCSRFGWVKARIHCSGFEEVPQGA